MSTFDDVPDDDGPFTVVRPTRWKSRDDGATVDPDLLDDEIDTTSYTLGPDTPSPAKDDDDHVELGMDDISAEWAEPPGEDEAALGHLLAPPSARSNPSDVRAAPRSPSRSPSPPPSPRGPSPSTTPSTSTTPTPSPRGPTPSTTPSPSPRVPCSRPPRDPRARRPRPRLLPNPPAGPSRPPRVASSSNASARAAKAKDWIAESASLRAKRRLAERAAHPTGVKLPDPDLEAHARRGPPTRAKDASRIFSRDSEGSAAASPRSRLASRTLGGATRARPSSAG